GFIVDQLIGVGLGTFFVVERFGFGLSVCPNAAEADGDIASVDRDLPEFRRVAFDEFEIPLVAAASRRSAGWLCRRRLLRSLRSRSGLCRRGSGGRRTCGGRLARRSGIGSVTDERRKARDAAGRELLETVRNRAADWWRGLALFVRKPR